MTSTVETLAWRDDALHVLDQLLLPAQIQYVVCRTQEQVADTIRRMQIRGAPAIGVAAAFGMALAVKTWEGPAGQELSEHWMRCRRLLADTRPTAVNLFWALDRMQKLYDRVSGQDLEKIREATLTVAQKIYRDDVEANRTMGRNGAALVPDPARILTHCNAGALATAGYGTALGVIRAAAESGKNVHVWVSETRPYLQGARLTAWEMDQEQIPYTVIADNMAGTLMRQGKVDLVIVGADRITAKGDVANKIGTYQLAVLCHYHHIPLYVAAPLSTFDRSISQPEQIVIEERPAEELSKMAGVTITPAKAQVYNPSFDVTPHALVSAIVSPVGVLYPPYDRSITRAFDKQALLEGSPSQEV